MYMTSHVHMVVTAPESELQNSVRDFKKFTSKKIIEAIKEHPESRREWLLRKFSYAAEVRAGTPIPKVEEV
ncbi:hypothetical protein [Flavobacterium sp. 7A]|uniref:hypothetical protein n=1 Tax=Flavobacterium sp. 7A TaxID=2940571 RepID=UPI002226FA98